MLQWAQGCTCLIKVMTSLSLDKYPKVELLNPRIILFLTFWGACILFSTVVVPIYLPTDNAQVSLFSKSPSALVTSCLFFFFFREGKVGRKRRETSICGVSHPPLTGDMTHNPGMCPDWELNQRLFGSQAGTWSTEPHQPGLLYLWYLSSKRCEVIAHGSLILHFPDN